jgi:predicted transcriptional regulator
MGTTKSQLFDASQNNLATITKALGHPARVAILDHIIKSGSCYSGDITLALPLAQPTVSQHLKELKRAGLVKGTIAGTNVCYCAQPDTILQLRNYLDMLLSTASAIDTSEC